MCRLARYSGAGLAALILADCVAPLAGTSWLSTLMMPAPVGSPVIERGGKGDRLVAFRPTGDQKAVISAVEVVGLSDAAVVYRDRSGRVLFQTDPLSNATVIAKDVQLPKVTIRETSRSTVEPVRLEPARTPPAEQKLPIGCDPAFSPLHASARSNITGRCLAGNTAAEPAVRLAALQ
jgi:hypothetical protein